MAAPRTFPFGSVSFKMTDFHFRWDMAALDALLMLPLWRKCGNAGERSPPRVGPLCPAFFPHVLRTRETT